LKIQQSGGDGSTGTEREQNDEEAAAVCAEKPAEDATENG
jgi:hypothetical protein